MLNMINKNDALQNSISEKTDYFNSSSQIELEQLNDNFPDRINTKLLSKSEVKQDESDQDSKIFDLNNNRISINNECSSLSKSNLLTDYSEQCTSDKNSSLTSLNEIINSTINSNLTISNISMNESSEVAQNSSNLFLQSSQNNIESNARIQSDIELISCKQCGKKGDSRTFNGKFCNRICVGHFAQA
jgi:hypothetical protein